jgi:hypothetical protein
MTQEKTKAMTAPETLDQFMVYVRNKGESTLTPEQMAKYDELRAYQRRQGDSVRMAGRAVVASPVTGGGVGYSIHEGVHSRTQKPQHIVKMAERVDGATFKSLAEKARQLGGSYQTNSRYGPSPDGFNFSTKEAAERFGELLSGKSVSRLEDWQQGQAESRQATAQRMRDLASRKESRADESLGRERKDNTVRRARMAEYAEKNARAEKARAATLTRIAEKIESGEAKHLVGLRHGSHVEALNSALNQAIYHAERKGVEKDIPLGEEHIRHAEYPFPWFTPGDLHGLAGKMSATPGAKRLGEKVRKIADAVQDSLKESGNNGNRVGNSQMLETLVDVAKNAEGYGLNKSEASMLQYKLGNYMRLQSADIKSTPELRAALREYYPLKSEPQEADAVKQKERALRGQKIQGFFPTPRHLVDQMLDLADIQPGHTVLEPSAGKGDILDAIRERHPDAQTFGIEPHSALADIVRTKGHDVQMRDFMDVPVTNRGAGESRPDRIVMNPPFEDGQDMTHVQHAYNLLKPGGKMVAIMSEGPFSRQDGKATAFRSWLDSVQGEHEQLPSGSFAGNDSFNQTGVSTRLVTISKPG